MNPPARPAGLALLKMSVIVMGVLILVGLGAVVYGVITKTGGAMRAAEQLDVGNAVVLRLGLPAQTQVRAMSVADRTLSLHLAIPGQGEWIYVVPLSGEGRILKIAIGAGETKP